MTAVTHQSELDQAIELVQARFSGELGVFAKNLNTGETAALNADALSPTASIIKLPILVELYRQIDAGIVDPAQRLTVRADDWVGGSGILRELGPGLNPTVHDVATLMIVMSDNIGTNLITDLVGGPARVTATMRELGLVQTFLHNRVDFTAIGDDVRRFAESTPRDMAALIELIATDHAASAVSCAAMLDILRRQVYLDQAPRYLDYSPYAPELGDPLTLRVGCKTGFFPGTRADVGIIALADDVSFVYCTIASGSIDQTMTPESEPAVVNGVVGRLLVEHWWPAARGAAPLLASPHVERFLA